MTRLSFRPSVTALDERTLPSVSLVAPASDLVRGASFTSGGTTTAATADDLRLTSEVLRVQDYVDGLLAGNASKLDTVSQTAAASGQRQVTGSRTVVFQPLGAPGGGSGTTPPGGGSTTPPGGGTTPPPGGGTGGIFDNGLPGVQSGTVRFDWSGTLVTRNGVSSAAYRVTVTTVADVTLQDTARPGRTFVVRAGESFTYVYTCTNQGDSSRYASLGAAERLRATATENGTTEQLGVRLAFDIAVTPTTGGGQGVSAKFWVTATAVGPTATHTTALRVVVNDDASGRHLTTADFQVDGRRIATGYTANDI